MKEKDVSFEYEFCDDHECRIDLTIRTDNNVMMRLFEATTHKLGTVIQGRVKSFDIHQDYYSRLEQFLEPVMKKVGNEILHDLKLKRLEIQNYRITRGTCEHVGTFWKIRVSIIGSYLAE